MKKSFIYKGFLYEFDYDNMNMPYFDLTFIKNLHVVAGMVAICAQRLINKKILDTPISIDTVPEKYKAGATDIPEIFVELSTKMIHKNSDAEMTPGIPGQYKISLAADQSIIQNMAESAFVIIMHEVVHVFQHQNGIRFTNKYTLPDKTIDMEKYFNSQYERHALMMSIISYLTYKPSRLQNAKKLSYASFVEVMLLYNGIGLNNEKVKKAIVGKERDTNSLLREFEPNKCEYSKILKEVYDKLKAGYFDSMRNQI